MTRSFNLLFKLWCLSSATISSSFYVYCSRFLSRCCLKFLTFIKQFPFMLYLLQYLILTFKLFYYLQQLLIMVLRIFQVLGQFWNSLLVVCQSFFESVLLFIQKNVFLFNVSLGLLHSISFTFERQCFLSKPTCLFSQITEFFVFLQFQLFIVKLMFHAIKFALNVHHLASVSIQEVFLRGCLFLLVHLVDVIEAFVELTEEMHCLLLLPEVPSLLAWDLIGSCRWWFMAIFNWWEVAWVWWSCCRAYAGLKPFNELYRSLLSL